MSVLPLQNSTNPSPVPGPSTDAETSGFAFVKFSVTSCVIGCTVEEPEIVSVPLTALPLAFADCVSLFEEHADATITRVPGRLQPLRNPASAHSCDLLHALG